MKTIKMHADTLTDFVKVNKIRRSRGYNLEHALVELIDGLQDGNWHCRRLGGSSTGLPDLIAVNNRQSQLLVFECKSGGSRKNGKYADKLIVPPKEIYRCLDIYKMFSIYNERFIVFAFKFSQPKGHKIIAHNFYLPLDIIVDKDNWDFKHVYCKIDGTCMLVTSWTELPLSKFDLVSYLKFKLNN